MLMRALGVSDSLIMEMCCWFLFLVLIIFPCWSDEKMLHEDFETSKEECDVDKGPCMNFFGAWSSDAERICMDTFFLKVMRAGWQAKTILGMWEGTWLCGMSRASLVKYMHVSCYQSFTPWSLSFLLFTVVRELTKSLKSFYPLTQFAFISFQIQILPLNFMII